MKQESGIDAAGEIAAEQPGCKIIFCTSFPEDVYKRQPPLQGEAELPVITVLHPAADLPILHKHKKPPRT